MKKIVSNISIIALLCLQSCGDSHCEHNNSDVLANMENDYLEQVEKLVFLTFITK